MTPLFFSAYSGPRRRPDDGGTTVRRSGMDAAQARIEAEEGSVLTTRDQEILAFERQWWKYAGAKEQAIRELFDMSATRYYQVLNALIDSPEALAFDPMLVKRLRRMRASRQRARSARRLGIQV
jgi:hypothetical protein